MENKRDKILQKGMEFWGILQEGIEFWKNK